MNVKTLTFCKCVLYLNLLNEINCAKEIHKCCPEKHELQSESELCVPSNNVLNINNTFKLHYGFECESSKVPIPLYENDKFYIKNDGKLIVEWSPETHDEFEWSDYCIDYINNSSRPLGLICFYNEEGMAHLMLSRQIFSRGKY